MLHNEDKVHNGFAGRRLKRSAPECRPFLNFAGCEESRAAYLRYAVFTKRIAAEFMQ